MLAELRDRLFERIDGNQRWVLTLLDPNHPVASTHPLHLDRLTGRQPVPEILAIPRDDRMSDPDSHPRLLVLRRPEDRGHPDAELLELTMDCALKRRLSINGAYVCGWLVVGVPPEEIASQIRRSCILIDAAAGRRKVVPLFEPHRMALASRLAPPQWLARWLGAICSWFLIDACGQLKEIQPGLHEAQTTDSPDHEFWRAQSRVKQAREVLLAMVKAEQVLPVDCEIRIDASLQAAYREGLSDTEDIIFFATNHMTLSSGWHSHPAIRACIASARSGQMALTHSMTSLPDKVLEELSNSNSDLATRRSVPRSS